MKKALQKENLFRRLLLGGDDVPVESSAVKDASSVEENNNGAMSKKKSARVAEAYLAAVQRDKAQMNFPAMSLSTASRDGVNSPSAATKASFTDNFNARLASQTIWTGQPLPFPSNRIENKQLPIHVSLLDVERENRSHLSLQLSGKADNTRRASGSTTFPNASSSRRPNRDSDDETAALQDPAVQAFMQRRRERLAREKELALIREIRQEAKRLQIPLDYVPVCEMKETVSSVLERPLSKLSCSSTRSVPSQPSTVESKTDATIITEEVPVKQAANKQDKEENSLVNADHLLHPSNQLALQAAMTLLEHARSRAGDTDIPTALDAAVALAGQWIVQLAEHQRSIQKNNKTQLIAPAKALTLPAKKSFRDRDDVIASVSGILTERLVTKNETKDG